LSFWGKEEHRALNVFFVACDSGDRLTFKLLTVPNLSTKYLSMPIIQHKSQESLQSKGPAIKVSTKAAKKKRKETKINVKHRRAH